ncbi:MAG: hypothetical protein LiPW30_420 [Parcubacteria group bacterium LiPW_30]|nr:MAG: hypothetical protein LiPW30_420 [Parcubacteria group bacterium LiPW_30]
MLRARYSISSVSLRAPIRIGDFLLSVGVDESEAELFVAECGIEVWKPFHRPLRVDSRVVNRVLAIVACAEFIGNDLLQFLGVGCLHPKELSSTPHPAPSFPRRKYGKWGRALQENNEFLPSSFATPDVNIETVRLLLTHGCAS